MDHFDIRFVLAQRPSPDIPLDRLTFDGLQNLWSNP